MCDRSRGRSGCTRRRTTTPGQWAVPRVDFRRERVTVATRRGSLWDPEHDCHTPFSRNRVSCASARSLVPGSPWRSCTEQPHLPHGVAATTFSTMIATRHSMRCHARTPHSQKLTQRSSAHPTPAAPDPHSPNREQGTGPALRATVAILHRTTPPATWCGTTPTPTHDCHKDTSKVMPHAPCRIVTPGHPHHAWASTTTPEHPPPRLDIHHAKTSVVILCRTLPRAT